MPIARRMARRCEGRLSRGGSVIVLQQSTEPLTRQNAPVAERPRRQWHDQLIAQTLMIPFAMIVLDELGDGSSERPLPDANQPVQADSLIVRTNRAANALRLGE